MALNGFKKLALLISLIFSILLGGLTFYTKPFPSQEIMVVSQPLQKTASAASASITPLWSESKLDHLPTTESHAINLVETDQGLNAVWYGGSSEAEPDVSLYWSSFDDQNARWATPRKILTAAQVSQQTHKMTRLIGNASAVYHQNKVYVFFVSVGAGGWAASALNVIVSADEGQTWSKVRRLITSPILNVSTLVRAPVQVLADGNLWIPAYFEGHVAYPLMIKISPDLTVLGIEKLTRNSPRAIQSSLLQTLNSQIVLSRTMNKQKPEMVLSERSIDTETIHTHQLPHIKNSDSALSAAWLNSNQAMVVYNHTDLGRASIDLALSDDTALNWQHVLQIAYEKEGRFGYPALLCRPLKAKGSSNHPERVCDLLFTVKRTYFQHIRFNEAGLKQRMAEFASAGRGS